MARSTSLNVRTERRLLRRSPSPLMDFLHRSGRNRDTLVQALRLFGKRDYPRCPPRGGCATSLEESMCDALSRPQVTDSSFRRSGAFARCSGIGPPVAKGSPMLPPPGQPEGGTSQNHRSPAQWRAVHALWRASELHLVWVPMSPPVRSSDEALFVGQREGCRAYACGYPRTSTKPSARTNPDVPDGGMGIAPTANVDANADRHDHSSRSPTASEREDNGDHETGNSQHEGPDGHHST